MRKCSFVCLLSLFLVYACQPVQEVSTTIFLVRHAEKDTTMDTEDPPLTEKGQKRAVNLWENLDVDSVHALYSTDYNRTQATLEPLSAQFNLPINIYEAHDFEGFANELREKHSGQTVVVSGHSNTILPIIEALGATPPLDSIGEQEYDHIFTVEIAGEKARAKVKEYQNVQ
ncbi:SixA phosphatase family protein [Catalinimonas niigatensis]|uniref:SixA phosphatase family protein n=1 Tax=Catalinimonas niigatensis TaxID=1397264 RepID=UPI002665AAD0|nr:histidine phosphatase family protein [Catalinimonas niigatensis]WPP50817.1 histidine phosphatase family protein [Catalinimonas niigatensis]